MEEVARGFKSKRVRNEAVFLYEMNADEVFQNMGYIVIDSSLGLIGPSMGTPGANARGKPSAKDVH